MKIGVENAQCAGNGSCYDVDPDLFPLDEDGYSAVGTAREVPAGKENLAQQGVDVCPMAALYVEE